MLSTNQFRLYLFSVLSRCIIKINYRANSASPFKMLYKPKSTGPKEMMYRPPVTPLSARLYVTPVMTRPMSSKNNSIGDPIPSSSGSRLASGVYRTSCIRATLSESCQYQFSVSPVRLSSLQRPLFLTTCILHLFS